ncbi:MAG: hypothetical protein JWO55_792 [Candidatus Saccharibacteria bacterium]|jgi:hypothetical protein|nr:hypothetical protein [Candidatus Saccharibacteria bacterium]
MNIRRNKYNPENRNGDRMPPADARAFKEENGQIYKRVGVDFGPGYTYVPVDTPVADAPVQLPSAALRMEDRFRAALAASQITTERTADIQPSSADKAETLQRALRAQEGLRQHIVQELADIQEANAREEMDRVREEMDTQNALDQEALKYVVTTGGVVGIPKMPLPAHNSQINTSTVAHSSERKSVEAQDKPTRARMNRKVSARVLVASGVLVVGAGAAAAVVVPNDLTAAFLGKNDTQGNDEAKEMLPLPTAALVDSFAGCLDDNGAGPSLIDLPVTSQIEVGYSYTGSKNTPKILETSFYDDNNKLIKANAKPVIVTSNAPAKVAACIPEADRVTAVTAEGSKVTVDLSKISTQLYQDVNVGEIARGFAVSNTVANPLTDLYPLAEVINGIVEESKARPDTDEKMTPEIAAGIQRNYDDKSNVVAEIRQAQVKTVQALIRPGGGYAEKIKAFVKERIVEKIKARAAELKQQGLTDVESPSVVFVSEAENLEEKNPEPPQVDSFKLADAVKITSFPNTLNSAIPEAKK